MMQADGNFMPFPDPGRQPPPSAAEVPERLRKHYQRDGNFCAASGLESLAKLEGKLQPGEFPLQIDSSNEHRGFGEDERKLLLPYRLIAICRDAYSGEEAAQIIGAEIDADRFPLVSLPVFDEKGALCGYHVHIFAKHQGEALWINPAFPRVEVKGIPNIGRRLEVLRQKHKALGHYETLPILIYQRQADPS